MKLLGYFTAPLILSLSVSFTPPCNLGENKAFQINFRSDVIAEKWKYESLGKDLLSSDLIDPILGLFLRFYGPAPAWSEEDMEEAPPDFAPEQNGMVIEARTGGGFNARI